MKNYIIVGGPKTGKTTLAAKMLSEGNLRAVIHCDDYINLGWSEASAELANKMDSWKGNEAICLEGVAAVRGLRKWLLKHMGPIPAQIIYLIEPYQKLTPGQAAMAKGVKTVYDEIHPELLRRGTVIQIGSDGIMDLRYQIT